jgi:hypothetical protein
MAGTFLHCKTRLEATHGSSARARGYVVVFIRLAADSMGVLLVGARVTMTDMRTRCIFTLKEDSP